MSELAAWKSDATDIKREERKREHSPSSFFCSQGHALVLAARYFKDERLATRARGAVALKHRHRLHLALFGQLMASFEFLLKDFVASVIDIASEFDDAYRKLKWVTIDVDRVLLFRSSAVSPGSLLIHPTLGWQDPAKTNERYQELFGRQPISKSEVPRLEQLWILRHSVAHNAGFVTAVDARRGGMAALAGKVASIDAEYVKDSYDFLTPIARRIAEQVGDAVIQKWFESRQDFGVDYKRDKATYQALKLLATCIKRRTEDLPKITKGLYTQDYKRPNAANAATDEEA